MGRTRPGVDRIKRQELTAQAVAAEQALPAHMKQCHTCNRAGSNVRQRCDTWWQLAKAAHRARRALRAWKEPDTKGMTPLFGAELCDTPPF